MRVLAKLLNKLLQPAYRLIAPGGEACLACGRTASLLRGHSGLCKACFEGIPWIWKPRCVHCGRPVGCPDCTRTRNGPRHYVLNRSAVAYNDQMRAWLAQYKYRGNERYEKLLSAMLFRAYRQMRLEMEQEPDTANRPFFYNKCTSNDDSFRPNSFRWQAHLITSVPISESRLRERGFNQAENMARGLAALCQIPYAELLTRPRHTDKQSFKGRLDRLRSMEGMFEMYPGADRALVHALSNRVHSVEELTQADSLLILLVDDIYTTGSTVNACSRALQTAGASAGTPVEVFSLTWARS